MKRDVAALRVAMIFVRTMVDDMESVATQRDDGSDGINLPFPFDWMFDGRQSQRILHGGVCKYSNPWKRETRKDAPFWCRLVGTFCRNFRADTRNNPISLLQGDGDHVEDGNGPNHLLTNKKKNGRPGTTSITSFDATDEQTTSPAVQSQK